VKQIKGKARAINANSADSPKAKALDGDSKIIEVLNKIFKAITGRDFDSGPKPVKAVKQPTKPVIKSATPPVKQERKKAPARKPAEKARPEKAQRKVARKNHEQINSPKLESNTQDQPAKAPAPVITRAAPVSESAPVVTPNNPRDQSGAVPAKVIVVDQSGAVPAKVIVVDQSGRPEKKEEKEARKKGANGQFVSGEKAAQAQKEQREKADKKAEQSELRNVLEGVAAAATGGNGSVDAVVESDVGDAVGTTVGGSTWTAGKEMYDAAKEVRAGVEGAKNKLGEFKEKRVERKELKAQKVKDKAEEEAYLEEGSREGTGTQSDELGAFKKLFKKISLKSLRQGRQTAEAVEEQTTELVEAAATENRNVVEAIEENATVVEGGGGGGFSMDRKLGGVGAALSKFVKFAGGPLAGIIAGVMKYSEVKDDETLTDGQKTAQVVSTGGGAAAGAIAGGTAGAALGSFVPFIGTAIGGLIGAAVGGYLGSEGGEVIGEAISDNMDGPEELAAQAKADAAKPEAVEAMATPAKAQVAEAKPELVKTDYITPQPIQSPRPMKPKPEPAAKSDSSINKATGLPNNAAKAKAQDAGQISDPIVKAIENLGKKSKQSGGRSFGPSAAIPTEFDSEILTLMANDKL
jgi:hypothetical protein